MRPHGKAVSGIWKIMWCVWVLLFVFNFAPIPLLDLDLFTNTEFDIPVKDNSLKFNADDAFQMTREFVTQFPSRLFGSLEARQSTGYLTDRLEAMGYEVEYSHYDGRIGKSQQAGRNVLALKRGKTDEILVIMAHFDTARPTVQGASKNGAAVGVLLELADLFSMEQTDHSLLFAFTDGGEWGSTGARELTLNYAGKDRVVAALSLDHVAPGNLAGFQLGVTGQLRGSTDPRLVKVVEKAIGFPVESSESRYAKILERAFMISSSDHGPFLREGITSFNLGSYSTNGKWEAGILHSSEDVIDNLKVGSIEQFGRTAEKTVRLIDGMKQISDGASMGELSERVQNAMFYFMLLMPVLFSWCVCPPTKGCRQYFAWSRIGRELMALSITCIPLFLIYFGIRLAYAARQFPLYDLYPATAKDPAMSHPPAQPLLIIAAAVLFAAIMVWIIGRYFLKEWGTPDGVNSKTALMAVMAVIVLLALIYNPFWAIVFLLFPAMAWSAMGTTFHPNKINLSLKRIGNFILVLIPMIPAFSALGWLARQLGMGWNFYWYQTLALATGLFSPYAFFLAAITIAVGIRFLVISRIPLQRV